MGKPENGASSKVFCLPWGDWDARRLVLPGQQKRR